MKKKEARREFHQESHLATVMNFPFLFLLIVIISLLSVIAEEKRETEHKKTRKKKENKKEMRNVVWNRNSKLAGLTESKFDYI